MTDRWKSTFTPITTSPRGEQLDEEADQASLLELELNMNPLRRVGVAYPVAAATRPSPQVSVPQSGIRSRHEPRMSPRVPSASLSSGTGSGRYFPDPRDINLVDPQWPFNHPRSQYQPILSNPGYWRGQYNRISGERIGHYSEVPTVDLSPFGYASRNYYPGYEPMMQQSLQLQHRQQMAYLASRAPSSQSTKTKEKPAMKYQLPKSLLHRDSQGPAEVLEIESSDAGSSSGGNSPASSDVSSVDYPWETRARDDVIEQNEKQNGSLAFRALFDKDEERNGDWMYFEFKITRKGKPLAIRSFSDIPRFDLASNESKMDVDHGQSLFQDLKDPSVSPLDGIMDSTPLDDIQPSSPSPAKSDENLSAKKPELLSVFKEEKQDSEDTLESPHPSDNGQASFPGQTKSDENLLPSKEPVVLSVLKEEKQDAEDLSHLDGMESSNPLDNVQASSTEPAKSDENLPAKEPELHSILKEEKQILEDTSPLDGIESSNPSDNGQASSPEPPNPENLPPKEPVVLSVLKEEKQDVEDLSHLDEMESSNPSDNDQASSLEPANPDENLPPKEPVVLSVLKEENQDVEDLSHLDGMESSNPSDNGQASTPEPANPDENLPPKEPVVLSVLKEENQDVEDLSHLDGMESSNPSDNGQASSPEPANPDENLPPKEPVVLSVLKEENQDVEDLSHLDGMESSNPSDNGQASSPETANPDENLPPNEPVVLSVLKEENQDVEDLSHLDGMKSSNPSDNGQASSPGPSKSGENLPKKKPEFYRILKQKMDIIMRQIEEFEEMTRGRMDSPKVGNRTRSAHNALLIKNCVDTSKLKSVRDANALVLGDPRLSAVMIKKMLEFTNSKKKSNFIAKPVTYLKSMTNTQFKEEMEKKNVKYIVYFKDCEVDDFELLEYVKVLRKLQRFAGVVSNVDVFFAQAFVKKEYPIRVPKDYPNVYMQATMARDTGLTMMPLWTDQPKSIKEKAQMCAHNFEFVSRLNLKRMEKEADFSTAWKPNRCRNPVTPAGSSMVA